MASVVALHRMQLSFFVCLTYAMALYLCPVLAFPSPHFTYMSNVYREKGFLGVDFIIVFDIVQMFLSFPYYEPMKKNTSFFSSHAKKKNTQATAFDRFKASSMEAFDRVSERVQDRVRSLKEEVPTGYFISRAGTVVFAAGALVLGVLQWLAVFVVLIALAKVIAGFVVVFWPILLLGVTLLLAGLAIRASVIDNPLQGLFI